MAAPKTTKAPAGIYILAWALKRGAGDGNRTRAVSLGIIC